MARVDYKKLKNKILDKYPTKEDTLQFFRKHHKYFTAGYYEAKNFNEYDSKFSIRKNDKTPSTHCKPRLTTIDFGDEQKHKDILQLLIDVHNEKDDGKFLTLPKAFPIAVQMLAKLEEEDENQNMDDYVYVPPPIIEKKKASPLTERFLLRQKRNRYKDDESKKIFKNLINGLCRTCSNEEKNRFVKIFNVGLDINFKIDKETNQTVSEYRLFIPEYSSDLSPYGYYKYNRSIKERKGLLRPKAHRVLFGVHLINTFNMSKPIIFAEGHSDVVVNNSKRLQTITSGSATTKIGENISELKGKTLHLYYDLDDAGVKGITRKVIEIEVYNQSQEDKDKIKYKIFQWSSKVIIDGEVKDFVDFEKAQIDIIKKSIGDTRNKITLTETYLFEKSRILYWKTLSEQPKKEGYDWIDFHEEMKDHPKYEKFINTYKY